MAPQPVEQPKTVEQPKPAAAAKPAEAPVEKPSFISGLLNNVSNIFSGFDTAILGAGAGLIKSQSGHGHRREGRGLIVSGLRFGVRGADLCGVKEGYIRA